MCFTNVNDLMRDEKYLICYLQFLKDRLISVQLMANVFVLILGLASGELARAHSFLIGVRDDT